MEYELYLRGVRDFSKDSFIGKIKASAFGKQGVLVTAFGNDPDEINKGTLLRVWEQAGITGKVTVKLPKAMKVSKATAVNLRGEKTGETKKVRSGKLKFKLGKYAPASFILE